MVKTYSNRCSRCGKERVVSRTWEEVVGGSKIQNTEKICPDKACQKAVESENKKQRDKYAQMKANSQQRAADRKESARLKKKKKG